MNLIKILFLILTLVSLCGCGGEESSITTQVNEPFVPEVLVEIDFPGPEDNPPVMQQKSFICISGESLDEQIFDEGSSLIYGCIEKNFVKNNLNVSVFKDNCQEFFKSEKVKILSDLSCNDKILENIFSSPDIFTLGECMTDGDDLLYVKDVVKKYLFRGKDVDTFKKVRDVTGEFCQSKLNGLWLPQAFN